MRDFGFMCCAVIAVAVTFALGVRYGEKTAEKSILTDAPVKADTLVVRDTIIETKPVYVVKTRTETITDTLYLKGDTVRVEVEMPVSYERASYADAEVWYHGYKAGIDSLRVYPETKVITKNRNRAPSKWSFGISGGLGAGKGGLTPYIGIGLTYDLVRF